MNKKYSNPLLFMYIKLLISIIAIYLLLRENTLATSFMLISSLIGAILSILFVFLENKLSEYNYENSIFIVSEIPDYIVCFFLIIAILQPNETKYEYMFIFIALMLAAVFSSIFVVIHFVFKKTLIWKNKYTN